jgi:hypothetical protein
VLVLSKAVLVLVIAHDTVPGRPFGHAVLFQRHSSQHRDNPVQFPFPVPTRFGAQPVRGYEHVLDCGTFQRRASRNLQVPRAIIRATLAVSFGDVQRNRWSCPQPWIAGVAMKSRQPSGHEKRLSRVLDSQPVNVEAIVIEDRFDHRRSLRLRARAPPQAAEHEHDRFNAGTFRITRAYSPRVHPMDGVFCPWEEFRSFRAHAIPYGPSFTSSLKWGVNVDVSQQV